MLHSYLSTEIEPDSIPKMFCFQCGATDKRNITSHDRVKTTNTTCCYSIDYVSDEYVNIINFIT